MVCVEKVKLVSYLLGAVVLTSCGGDSSSAPSAHSSAKKEVLRVKPVTTTILTRGEQNPSAAQHHAANIVQGTSAASAEANTHKVHFVAPDVQADNNHITITATPKNTSLWKKSSTLKCHIKGDQGCLIKLQAHDAVHTTTDSVEFRAMDKHGAALSLKPASALKITIKPYDPLSFQLYNEQAFSRQGMQPQQGEPRGYRSLSIQCHDKNKPANILVAIKDTSNKVRSMPLIDPVFKGDLVCNLSGTGEDKITPALNGNVIFNINAKKITYIRSDFGKLQACPANIAKSTAPKICVRVSTSSASMQVGVELPWLHQKSNNQYKQVSIRRPVGAAQLLTK